MSGLIYDIIDMITEFIDFTEYDKLKSIDKTWEICINNKICKYKNAVNKIKKFTKYHSVNKHINDITKKTLIRLYIRTYPLESIYFMYKWSSEKIYHLLDNEQKTRITNYIENNRVFNRRNMKEYLHMLNKEQIIYMGY